MGKKTFEFKLLRILVIEETAYKELSTKSMELRKQGEFLFEIRWENLRKKMAYVVEEKSEGLLHEEPIGYVPCRKLFRS